MDRERFDELMASRDYYFVGMIITDNPVKADNLAKQLRSDYKVEIEYAPNAEYEDSEKLYSYFTTCDNEDTLEKMKDFTRAFRRAL